MGGRRASLYKPGITRNCHGCNPVVGASLLAKLQAHAFSGFIAQVWQLLEV